MQLLKPIHILFFLCFIFEGIHHLDAQVSWSVTGPGGGGWITALTVVNDDAHTVYVGCDVGGIYKSTDHGKTWTIKDNGLSMYFMHDIEYDPENPEILYLASRGGVYKSVDGGDHWENKRNGFPPIAEFSFSAPISDIAIDPQHRNIIFAGVGVPNTGYDLDSYHWQSSETKGTIYKSVDFGEHWIPIYNSGIPTDAMIFSMAIQPDDSNIMYAATSAGVYKSLDAGATWVQKDAGLPHTLAMKLVINPQQTDMLYVTLWASPGSAEWEGGVYKSVNGGDTWVAKNTGLPQVVGDERGFTTNYPSMVMDPLHPDTLYVGNIPWTPDPGVYQSFDGGAHWSWVSRRDTENDNVDIGWIVEHEISPSVIAIDPQSSNRVYFASSTHIIKTEDTGLSWKQSYSNEVGDGYWSGNGFETTVAEKIAVDPKNSNNIYVGYWDIGLFKSRDGGQSFKKIDNGMTYKANNFDIIVDPDNSAIVYASCGWWEENQGEIYKSTDYGEHWTPLNQGIPDAQIWSMALDKNSPIDARILYAGSYENGVYKTIDGGLTWFPINTGLGVDGNLKIRKITIDPNNSNILYAGIDVKTVENGDNLSTTHGGLFKSTDAGAHWERIDSDSPQLTVYDIQIDPNNSNIIYTGVIAEYDHSEQEDYLGGVYKSMDGGNTWALLNNGFGPVDNLNIHAIAINPVHSDILYAVTTDDPFHDNSSGRGIFKSTDAGGHWSAINDGLGVLYYDAITIDPLDPSVLYAGSSGNGLFKGRDFDITAINTPDIDAVGVYPNPVSDLLFIKGKNLIHSITIVDVNGHVLLQKDLIAGENSVAMDNIPVGVYFIEIKSAGGDDWYKIVVER